VTRELETDVAGHGAADHAIMRLLYGLLCLWSLVSVGHLGGGLGLGWDLGVGLGRSGVGRSDASIYGVFRAKVARVAVLAQASSEHSRVVSMKVRCRLSYSEEATSSRCLIKHS
jgi:hypothetical protein